MPDDLQKRADALRISIENKQAAMAQAEYEMTTDPAYQHAIAVEKRRRFVRFVVQILFACIIYAAVVAGLVLFAPGLGAGVGAISAIIGAAFFRTAWRTYRNP